MHVGDTVIRVLPGISEASFTTQVIDLLHQYRWRCVHIRHAQVREGKWITHGSGDIAGWPDVFCVRGPRALALELKIGRNKATEAQLDWLNALGHVPGIEAHVIRPEQWDWLVELVK